MTIPTVNIQTAISSPLIVADDLEIEVLQGLLQEQKILPSKLFYDQQGSLLFDQICKLEEYYPTRTEKTIMEQNIPEIASVVGSGSLLIEYGSGSSSKTRLLLEHLPEMAGYVPVDISREHLYNTAENLNRSYPELFIFPLCADFTKDFSLPIEISENIRKLAYFPGSTIGNFYPHQAIDFMRNVASLIRPTGGFLIGIDLQKDPQILDLAYNDRKGITAAFNRNILTHINHRFVAKFNENLFEHRAFYNQDENRIEMHLISKENQLVPINGSVIPFYKGEGILTEVSYKYTVEGFAKMADQAGLRVQNVWADSLNYFSIQYLVPK